MQLNIFEFTRPKYKITKPIRLIELFAGIGSQAKALKNIGADFTHYKVVEFDKYALASYNAVHNTNFETQDITLTSAEDLEIVETRDGIVPTLTTRPDTLGVVQQVGSLRIRKLTPKETWRLMGFTDEDFSKAEKVNSNAQLYKQAGNSIVVQVLEEIFKELI